MYTKVIGLIIGYLFGCFSTAYIVGRILKKLDIREYGSGNSGTTNAIRVLGWKAGIIVFIGDFFKAVLAVLFVKTYIDTSAIVLAITAVGVVFGHNWPVFFKFKGGKGVASTLGVVSILNFKIALICAIFMVLVILITRYVSLASILNSILLPILFYYVTHEKGYILFAIIISIVTIYKHRTNIKRLLDGKESKLGQKVK